MAANSGSSVDGWRNPRDQEKTILRPSIHQLQQSPSPEAEGISAASLPPNSRNPSTPTTRTSHLDDDTIMYSPPPPNSDDQDDPRFLKGASKTTGGNVRSKAKRNMPNMADMCNFFMFFY